MTPRDRERLVGVHPQLVQVVERIFDVMEAEGAVMFVVKGVRTLAEQRTLYAQGRTQPGVIVTNKDGIRYRSDHQPHSDGLGYAVDCAFVGPQPFDPRKPWETYGEEVEGAGLVWGGRWSHPHDAPHAQLPDQPPIDETTVFP